MSDRWDNNRWDLYDTHRDYAAAAREMDEGWEQAKRLLPEAPSKKRAVAAEKHMAKVMSKWSDVGAYDSEPRWEVIDRVEKHFGVRGGWL